MGAIKVSKVNTIEKFFRKVGSGGKDTVNPFLTHMYFRISFLAWYNSALRHEREQDKKRNFGILTSKRNSAVDQSRSNEFTHYEEVVVDKEEYSIYTVSSDEEQALETNPSETQSQKTTKNEILLKLLTQRQARTPKSIREASKLRMRSYKDNLHKSEMTMKLDERKIRSQINQYLSPSTN
mmetsp:Transcript_25092/g.33642  ORF Transcript_25092/g.33642 Transcript_25092/m.33642 type:complete len:181 (+) Transcript_25092:1439-1981(+)